MLSGKYAWPTIKREKTAMVEKVTNPILDKNLEFIGRYNPKLKASLLELTSLSGNFELVETELKEPNIIFNGIPIHSPSGAEIEARAVFAQAPNTPSSMHVLFGMGLGFLFQEFCKNSKGILIVYEPNLEMLRVTLELVDFSKELSGKNVFVVSDMTGFKHIFMNTYSYGANSTFVFLQSYKNIYEQEMNSVFQQVELITGICMADYNTLRRLVANSIEMMIRNLPYTFEQTPLNELKDVYKGKTALIVSAGPTLDLNIETIKKNRNKVVIFCVGTAMKALMKNGITPDFLNMIEVNDCSGQLSGLDLSNVNLVLEPYTNTSIHKLKTKRKFSFATGSSHANECWGKITGVDVSHYVAKGSVSYEALFSAKILGFTRIILVGQDLAYVNNQCYSKDSAYSELAYEINPETSKVEVKIKDMQGYIDSLRPNDETGRSEEMYKGFADYKLYNLNDTMYYVDGVKGDKLPTQGGYATFIEHFREFASVFPNLELMNSSMIGAHIEGFENIPLSEALTFVAPIEHQPDLDKKRFSYDIEQSLNNLTKELDVLKKIHKEMELAAEYIYKYEREYNRRRTVSHETNKYFKLLLTLYNKIDTEYQADSPIYRGIAFSENLEIQYQLKNAQLVDAENIQKFYGQMKTYYEKTKINLENIIMAIEKQKKYIVESISATR